MKEKASNVPGFLRVLPALSLFLTTLLQGCGEQKPVIGPDHAKPVSVDSRVKKVIVQDGLRFRDLNGDGKLNPYEDWRLTAGDRADDLIRRMTVAEKAGTMMHSTLPGRGGFSGRSAEGYDFEALTPLLTERHVSSFISRLSLPPARLAEQNNQVQAIAEATRLGIPVTISTDPRHHFQYVLGASSEGGGFSQWPEPLGFAALRDPALVREFGDIARREYRAVGLHMALSPQADLATEPRWPRLTATFGSNAALTSDLVGAYVTGFQGSETGLATNGVMTVVKHWVGYGATADGYDSHNYYGRYARLDGDTLQPHIDAFAGAFSARSGGIMPTYPILQGVEIKGEPLEPVGAGFSRQLLTELLRDQYHYPGIILSDWAITRDCSPACRAPTKPQGTDAIAMPWGVESLTPYARFVKGVEAGLDQFGGTHETEHLIKAVEDGRLSENRLDESVRRILISKFQLGLFENPYVDPARAEQVVAAKAFIARADEVQREAQVLLENTDGLLPLAADKRKVFLFGMAPTAAEAAGLTVVKTPAQADFAIIRTETPSEMLHPNHFFGRRQHEGRLDFRDGDAAYEALKAASAEVPTVFAIFLDRPAVLSNIRTKASAILGNFGASDAAVLDVVLGRARARGRLPFELPVSMEAVESQHPAVADDSPNPLYPFGTGEVMPSGRLSRE